MNPNFDTFDRPVDHSKVSETYKERDKRLNNTGHFLFTYYDNSLDEEFDLVFKMDIYGEWYDGPLVAPKAYLVSAEYRFGSEVDVSDIPASVLDDMYYEFLKEYWQRVADGEENRVYGK